MQKEKTISVRNFVNYDLKTKIINGKEYSPVYVQVNYDGKNTKFKLEIQDYPIYVATKLGLKDSSYIALNDEILKQESLLKEIVLYEVKKHKSNFSLRRIGRRLRNYEKKLDYFFEALTKEDLERHLEDKMIYKDYLKMLSIKSYNERLNFVWDYFKDDIKKLINEDVDQRTLTYILLFVLFNKLRYPDGGENISNPFTNMNYFDWVAKGGRKQFIEYFKILSPIVKKTKEYNDDKYGEMLDLIIDNPEEIALELDRIAEGISKM